MEIDGYFSEFTDEDLVKEFTVGNKEAFAMLCKRYDKLIYQHILRCVRNREDAEDLAQDTLIDSYRQVRDFDPARSKWKTFLCRIAAKKILNYLRTRKRRSNYFVDLDENQNVISESTSNQEFDLRELRNILIEELEKLSPKEREMVSLRLDGVSFEEIANIVDGTYGGVKVSIWRNLKGIKGRLVELGYKLF